MLAFSLTPILVLLLGAIAAPTELKPDVLRRTDAGSLTYEIKESKAFKNTTMPT
jgi:hypothetical protein